MGEKKKKCLVIFSGGQDSTTCLGVSQAAGFETVAISFFYGQNHKIELGRASAIAKKMKIEHHIIDINFFGDMVESALTHDGDVNAKHPSNPNLPASFVPNRNMTFLTLSHAFAQKIGADFLMTGVCETDYSGYPDCRHDFIRLAENTLNIGSGVNIPILTPLMFLDKAQTWKLAKDTGVIDIVKEMSHTCYNGNDKMNEWGYGCGNCPACKLREKGYNNFIKEKYVPINTPARIKTFQGIKNG